MRLAINPADLLRECESLGHGCPDPVYPRKLGKSDAPYVWIPGKVWRRPNRWFLTEGCLLLKSQKSTLHRQLQLDHQSTQGISQPRIKVSGPNTAQQQPSVYSHSAPYTSIPPTWHVKPILAFAALSSIRWSFLLQEWSFCEFPGVQITGKRLKWKRQAIRIRPRSNGRSFDLALLHQGLSQPLYHPSLHYWPDGQREVTSIYYPR